MSVDAESEVRAAPAVAAGNPALLGLMTFLPSGITLGLWFVGYLDTAKLGGGMVPIVMLSAGLFQLVAAIWAGRLAQNTVAAIFAVFSAFWSSLGFLLIGITSGWWALDGDGTGSVRATFLLSFLLVFAFLTLATLRLPLMFTAGFVFVVITFALAYFGVATSSAGLFPIAGITTFLFCLVFAYILYDGINQDLGGRPLPMGNALVH